MWLGLMGFGALVVLISRRQNQHAQEGAEKLLCPHCQTRGSVEARAVAKGQGISGGKATGALLTGGISMLFTGLSRNQQVRRLHCRNCGTTWDVA